MIIKILKWLGAGFLIYLLTGVIINFIYLWSLRTLPTTENTPQRDSAVTNYHFNEYRGTYHFHTEYSDGSATTDELKSVSRNFDFVIPTDHNTLDPKFDGLTGYFDGVTILPEVEISTPDNSGHFTSIGFRNLDNLQRGDRFNDYKPNDKLFDGNINILAHPFHNRSKMNWEDFSQRYDGFEFWNYDVTWRNNLTNPFRIFSVINGIFFSDWFPWTLQGGVFYPETELHFIDTISTKPNLLMLGATDTHAKIKLFGDNYLKVPDYTSMLDIMTLHLLTEDQLNTQAYHNKTIIMNALRNGQFFIANDQLTSSNGFRSVWKVRSEYYSCISIHSFPDSAVWEIKIPKTETDIMVRLYHNGKIMQEISNTFYIRTNVETPGYYRAEVFQVRKSMVLFGYETLQPWIFTQRYNVDAHL